MSRAGLFFRSIRHTRPRQLAWRAWLVAKRQALAAAAETGAPRRLLEGSAPEVSEDPPQPVFPPRSGSVAGSGESLTVRFLNQERPLGWPIDWHPEGLEHGAHLWKMHLHSMEYLEGLDDGALERTVADWIERNPPYRAGYWLYDWNSYTVSIRAVVWMQQLAMRGARIPTNLRARMHASLAIQLRFLERNLERDLGGNHLLKDAKALVWAGAYFRGAEARRWGTKGRGILGREIALQVLPDGMHYERSPAYHAQVFADLVECRAVVEPSRFRDRLVDALARMAQVLSDTTHPDGRTSLFNDGGLHAAYAPGTCLDAWSTITGGSVAPRSVFALADAGYFGARAGESFVLADCGAIAPDFLPAHGHGDILSFEWSLRGARIVVDAGVFEYAAGPRRAESRSTQAHNTVTLDRLDQCEFWGSFRVGRRARATVHRFDARPTGFALFGSHDGYRRLPGSPVVKRTFDVTPERIHVRDFVDGGTGQAVEARLLLHPDCRPERVPGGLEIRNGASVALFETATPFEVERAEWWPDFGVRREATRVVLRYGAAPCGGAFALRGA